MSRRESPRPYQVLLVDEDLRTMRRLADILREQGVNAQIAGNGAQAVARLARDPVPDALVTELMTAYADGASLGRFARWRRPGMPVLIVTSHPHLFEASGFGQPHAVMFAKPVDYFELAEVLLGALRTSARALRRPT